MNCPAVASNTAGPLKAAPPATARTMTNKHSRRSPRKQAPRKAPTLPPAQFEPPPDVDSHPLVVDLGRRLEVLRRSPLGRQLADAQAKLAEKLPVMGVPAELKQLMREQRQEWRRWQEEGARAAGEARQLGRRKTGKGGRPPKWPPEQIEALRHEYRDRLKHKSSFQQPGKAKDFANGWADREGLPHLSSSSVWRLVRRPVLGPKRRRK
jgi:hypothetical protein